jgi:hypothetical protein
VRLAAKSKKKINPLPPAVMGFDLPPGTIDSTLSLVSGSFRFAVCGDSLAEIESRCRLLLNIYCAADNFRRLDLSLCICILLRRHDVSLPARMTMD